jgi:hypothetical protein
MSMSSSSDSKVYKQRVESLQQRIKFHTEQIASMEKQLALVLKASSSSTKGQIAAEMTITGGGEQRENEKDDAEEVLQEFDHHDVYNGDSD